LKNPEEEARLAMEQRIRGCIDIAKSKMFSSISENQGLAKSLIEVIPSSADFSKECDPSCNCCLIQTKNPKKNIDLTFSS
jgi:hypothetical protein